MHRLGPCCCFSCPIPGACLLCWRASDGPIRLAAPGGREGAKAASAGWSGRTKERMNASLSFSLLSASAGFLDCLSSAHVSHSVLNGSGRTFQASGSPRSCSRHRLSWTQDGCFTRPDEHFLFWLPSSELCSCTWAAAFTGCSQTVYQRSRYVEF